ncbi:motility protein A [Endothiovibrio diazotrophicus]
MNIATLLGMISGVAILAWAIFSATGEAGIFLYPQGIAIVLGGVIAATFICYPLRQVLGVFNTFAKVLGREDLPVASYIGEIHYLAQQAVAGGAIKLEKELQGVENYFLKDGLRMLVDRYPEEKLRSIMETSILNARNREQAEADILRTMAKLSPAFGMVGTLIGLIVMFKGMSGGLEAVGPGMATAMMTTFYGLLLAYLLFLPIAVKLERRIEERVVLMTVIMEGLVLVSKKTPPDLVMDELKAYLPPGRWQDITVRKAGG